MVARASVRAAQPSAGTDSSSDAGLQIELGLNAAIVTVREQQPYILVVRPGAVGSGEWDALPFGPFAPREHRTLEIGLRAWVEQQTGLDLGYVEQLYTFGDRGRHAQPEDDDHTHMLSIGYLALARDTTRDLRGSHWSPWYAYFPWEDWRYGKPEILSEEIEPRLLEWAERPPLPNEPLRALRRAERLKIGFGIGGGWDEEKVLERYELLYEAGLLLEAARDGRTAAKQWANLPELGRPMAFDHRRILATAISRLRGKLKYRPVVFELLPPEFTLYDLQQTVEAISGTLLHKQNFRRLVENAGLVEPTGGRPARLYRFRREVVLERPAPGLRVKAGRG